MTWIPIPADKVSQLLGAQLWLEATCHGYAETGLSADVVAIEIRVGDDPVLRIVPSGGELHVYQPAAKAK